MNKKIELIIVIPCYNEAKKLNIDKFQYFIERHPTALLCFVNDGSNDSTGGILNKIKITSKDAVEIISLEKNQGKAIAVYSGINYCHQKFDFEKIAYLDADLSASLEECFDISKEINHNIRFVFGSRIAKLDSNIKRKFYRFLIGRFIATLISRQLDLMVYDTQCGCKVFDHKTSKLIFSKKFISTWLFDVEIFHRLISIFGKDEMSNIAKEIPLKTWIDTDDSKVKFTYFFKLWFELLGIKRKYKSK
jgi:glycosyltransferase involved in cell wall biosynthesis